VNPSRHVGIVAAALAIGGFGLGACSRGDLPTAPSAVIAAAISPTPMPVVPPTTARYRVTFQATWSAATHPQEFPRFPHFSGLIGATHGSAAIFWRPGLVATEGIRGMAERGDKSDLQAEVNAAIAAGMAKFLISGGNIDVSPGIVTLEFDITSDYPLATLVTMVAPSPDWFVGVAGLALYELGEWKDSVTVDLFPYDAGTDSGVTFSSPDAETLPRQVIARIIGFPFLNGGSVLPLGTFRFDRIR